METPTQQPNYPVPPPPKPPKKHGRESAKSILSTLAVLIIAPIIALSLTSFVFQSYEVDGPSMETTLQNSDRLIVWKVARTWSKITGHAYIPKRTDVIIFNKDDLPSYGEVAQQKQLIKRVIGLPGERVVVKDGLLTIFNNEHPDGFQPDKIYPYGKVVQITPGDIDITLSKDQIFVCGDNRPDSLDSRSFGPISPNNIVGKLSWRIYPFGQAKHF
jgi:signal peptidase I